jgi:hypothetical protein
MAEWCVCPAPPPAIPNGMRVLMARGLRPDANDYAAHRTRAVK